MHGIGGIWHEKNALTVNFGDIFVRFYVGFFVLNYQVKFGILYSANSVNFLLWLFVEKITKYTSIITCLMKTSCDSF